MACRRLYIDANISLWLCNSNFQPQNCHSQVGSNNLTELSNVTVDTNITRVAPSPSLFSPSPSISPNRPPPSPSHSPSPSISPNRPLPSPSHSPSHSPSPLSNRPSPSPPHSSKTLRASLQNQTNTSETNETSPLPTSIEFTGLHALWIIMFVLVIVAYILRKKGVKIGLARRPRRSKSWPQTGGVKTNSVERSRSSPGTKVEFDSINSIEL
jgi:hypothetical protein